MPGVPEFIPLPKAKEMFALSSWRDSPGMHGPGSAGMQPSPLFNATDVLRGGQKLGMGAPQGSHNGSGSVEMATGPAATAAGPIVPSPLPADTPLSEEQGGKRKNAGGRASRKQRGGKGQSQEQQHQQQLDVDDFFLHVFLPVGVAYQTFSFEVQAQASPLRMMDVGMPIVLFPRRNKEGKDAASSNNGKDEGKRPGTEAAAGMHLSPFATPAVQAAKPRKDDGTPSPLPMLEEDGHDGRHAAAGGFLLPPPEHTVDGSHSASSGSKNGTAATTPLANATGGGGGAQAETTGLEGSGGGVEDLYQVSLLFAEKDEADRTAAFVKKRWPTAVVHVVPRNRSLLNASLVLKGLPSMNKTEYILEELEQLPYGPSYVRVHRGERGVYKNVIFIKYADREAAEDSKIRLERIFIGTRPLKVEFKKKCKVQGSDSAAAAAAANAHALHYMPGTHSPAPGSAAAVAGGGEDEEGTAVTGAAQVALQQMVRDLRVSTEHEGFAYKREELTKGELKLLKQLCQAYGLLFDMTEARVTVKRVLGGNLVPGMQGPGTHSAGPSPALRPHMPPPTPAWAPATPAPLRPMDFKGISHWKDIRGQQSTLGIVRPVGPEDGVPAFSAGRGRPV